MKASALIFTIRSLYHDAYENSNSPRAKAAMLQLSRGFCDKKNINLCVFRRLALKGEPPAIEAKVQCNK